jgi:hypothetical protein
MSNIPYDSQFKHIEGGEYEFTTKDLGLTRFDSFERRGKPGFPSEGGPCRGGILGGRIQDQICP